MDKVSIIIPIYNVEEYLRRCIDSVINQTYKNIEIILVNDGSPDNCASIIKEYKDPRIKVITQDNQGLSEARNNGIKISTGKYISFIDSDDYVDEDFIETLYYGIKKYKADIATCSHHYDGITERNLEVIDSNTAISYMINPTKAVFVSPANKLYKNKLFENIKFPKGKVYEEITTIYYLLNISKKTVVIPQEKYHYVIRQGSLSCSSFSNNEYDRISAAKEVLEDVKKNHKESIDRYKFFLMYSYLKSCEKIPTKIGWSSHSFVKEARKCFIKNKSSLKHIDYNLREVKLIKRFIISPILCRISMDIYQSSIINIIKRVKRKIIFLYSSRFTRNKGF